MVSFRFGTLGIVLFRKISCLPFKLDDPLQVFWMLTALILLTGWQTMGTEIQLLYLGLVQG